MERGGLNFSDFVYPTPKNDSSTRTRIKIDSTTGAAQEKMMMVLDAPFQVGEPAKFVGEVGCICSTTVQAQATVKFVLAGLRWIRQIGAERTIGFGRVQSVDAIEIVLTKLLPPIAGTQPIHDPIEELFPDQRCRPTISHRCAAPAVTTADTKFVLRIQPHNPFCVGGITESGNLIDSEEIIPGGVILGALSSMWRQGSGLPPNQFEVTPDIGRWNTLAKHFGKLVVTHAFPSQKRSNVRPGAVPLSLVAAEPWASGIPDTLFDVSLCSQPRLIPNGADGSKRPPVFQSDWKRHVVGSKAKAAFGWTSVPRELRVRTAIDADTLKAADEQLFAYHMVLPEQHEWLAYLSLGAVPNADRAGVLTELRQLLTAGIGPLGKTKTWADVSIDPISTVSPKWVSNTTALTDDSWVITLQTPAVLCDAESLRDPIGFKLQEAYDKTWREISADCLSLKPGRFYARQSLAAPRFAGRLPMNSNGQYYPFILTDAGSTFALEAIDDKSKAKDCIDKWLDEGIPACDRLLGGFAGDPDWKRCPYLNRHGYGEISVNPPWLTGAPSNDMPLCLRDES